MIHGNQLGEQTSPYLLQHAHNPVHWRPWGEAALAEARAADKPILLSVGYAACHWCHVMAHESFEDETTAALMNERFVSIKVDREERPDIDHIYMSALHALGEQGGWPLTMFLTPDGAPFWGGTYFPPAPRWGRPSFRQVLEGVSNAWRTRDEMIAHNAAALSGALAAMAQTRPGKGIGPGQLDQAVGYLLRRLDPEQGGMRGAPKFPNPPIFRLLWQDAWRTGVPDGRDALHRLLRRMSLGGIYDHLGGGFARYATDAVWLVPHFEKMLYDNAQLLELLALAHADHPDPLYAERAAETVTWLDRDMSAAPGPGGTVAFASSEDADSEGVEGLFYIWSEAAIDAVLGTDAPKFKQAYDVTPGGNWEGHTILRRIAPRGTEAEEADLARSRDRLFQARAERVRPGRDDKVLADWNGLAVSGLVRAAAVFDRPDWLERAERALDFVRHCMMRDGMVAHAWRLGRITAPGLLDDQAAMARGALALFEATGRPERLEQAIGFCQVALDQFADSSGAFHTTAAHAPDLPLGTGARPRQIQDGPTPSGNGLMAEVFGRLFHLTGEVVWRDRAEAVLRAFSGDTAALASMPTLLGAADLLEGATEVVVVGRGPAAEALAAAASAAPDPAVVVVRAHEPTALPLLHPAYGKSPGRTGAAAYACHGGLCGLPVTKSGELAAALRNRARS